MGVYVEVGAVEVVQIKKRYRCWSSTARMFALDGSSKANGTQHIHPRHQLGPKTSCGSSCCAPVASDPPSEVTLNARI